MSDSELDVDAFEDIPVEERPEKVQREPGRKFAYTKLSASMMKTWSLCKRKFHQSYIDGIKQPAQANFTLGTAVHYALEMANSSLMKNPRELNPMEVASYIRLFVNIASKEFAPNPELFDEGTDMLKRELQSGHISHDKIIGIEDEFDIVTPEGVRIYGFMDKLVEVDSNTIKIVDYKTSRTAMSYDDARSDYQIAMYDLAVALKFPQYENRILELRYLRNGESVTVRRTQEEMYRFKLLLVGVDAAIKEYLANIKEAPAGTINDFCNWCSYNKSCPEYVDRVNTFLPEAPSTHALTDESFVETWEKVTSIIKAAEQWKDQLKIWAVERLNASPDTRIFGKEREIFPLTTTTKDYDVSVVGKLVPLDDLLGTRTGEPLVKINKKKLETYLSNKGDRKLTKKVDEACIVKVNAPQIRIKNKK
jgi:putative RecB family exonuclease